MNDFSLLPYLTQRIDNVDDYLLLVKGKRLKQQFKKIIRVMTVTDQLWEYHWSAERGGRFNYSYGWCVVRDGQVVAEELIHTS
ncbi:hypothetical protein [Undibacterium sp. TS12]|uniref:hypothetical protein n=1 Tax=Undibacterium sp. TS12 TaxID=2908202 RepID=UPI001F4CD809|nr:hypothetical protein [Undibacterium sp. TS12]MCH8619593.1 hypothetical protein [Undibacterium sp. TS12]